MNDAADREERGASPASTGDIPDTGSGTDCTPAMPHGLLQSLTQLLALIGGALLLVAVGITLVSVTGRYAFDAPVPGDYELVEFACAVGIFLFFPYTHSIDGNITADFFTVGLSARHRRLLDIGNDIVFTIVAALLTWRLAAGFLDKYETGDTTILIQIPLWWAYGVAVLSMFLLTVVSVARIVAGLGALRR